VKSPARFYLGRLDLEQTDSAWPLSVDLGALGRLDKSVSGLRVQLGEPTLGLAAIASREQTAFGDPYCEGDVHVVGDPLKLTLSQTCEDEAVTGPLRNGGVVTEQLPIPIELTSEGMYRFHFNSPGRFVEPFAGLRGCHNDGPAQVPGISVFYSQDDVTQYLGPGRYLLNIYVPLAPGDSPPIDVIVERVP